MPRAPLVLAALLCLTTAGRSEWVTLNFTGVIDYAAGEDRARLGLAAGVPVSGTVRYQSSYSGYPRPVATNDMVDFNTLGSISLRAGVHTFTAAALEPPPPWLQLGDWDRYMRASIRLPDVPGGRTEDLETLQLGVSSNTPDGAGQINFSLALNRADGKPVGGELPRDPLPFVGGDGSFFVFINGPDPAGNHTEQLHLTGTVTGITLAPEPGTLALAGLGAITGLLAGARRRSSRR
jgi:hypothetical protein